MGAFGGGGGVTEGWNFKTNNWPSHLETVSSKGFNDLLTKRLVERAKALRELLGHLMPCECYLFLPFLRTKSPMLQKKIGQANYRENVTWLIKLPKFLFERNWKYGQKEAHFDLIKSVFPNKYKLNNSQIKKSIRKQLKIASKKR